MAKRRMFSLDVVNTDRFFSLPPSAQALYFHYGMHADDDGYVSSPKAIVRVAGCRSADHKLLCSEQFIDDFDSGVCHIRDWTLNNQIRKDRYTETIYQAEKNVVEKQMIDSLLSDKSPKRISMPEG